MNAGDFLHRLQVWRCHGYAELGDHVGMGIGTTTAKVLDINRKCPELIQTDPHQVTWTHTMTVCVIKTIQSFSGGKITTVFFNCANSLFIYFHLQVRLFLIISKDLLLCNSNVCWLSNVILLLKEKNETVKIE